MFSIKKVLNRKVDRAQAEVWSKLILDIRYTSEVELLKFIENANVTALHSADALTALIDHIVSSIDLYTENKFALPSTILGLRNATMKLTEGSQLFIAGVLDNLSDDDVPHDVIIGKLSRSVDLMMTARKMMLHIIEFEFKMIVMNVDVIERYYSRNKNNSSNDISFKISFKQPEHLAKSPKGVDKNGSDKRK